MARSTANARKKKPVPQKRDADGWVRRGRKYDHEGDEKKAMLCYLEAFNDDPKNLAALKLLSRKLIHLTERHLAIHVLEQAIQANPDDIEVYLILGNLALEMQMYESALSLFRLVCEMKPSGTAGPNNLATTLRDMERHDEAITVLQEALNKAPTVAPLWNTLATVVAARDGVEAALTFYQEALRLNPREPNVWSNLAKAHESVGYFEEAIEAGRKAIALNPEFPEPHVAISTALLSLGRLDEGWEQYEWRQHWRRPSSLRYVLECKRWDGEPLEGQTLLVCPEQGLGDELLFATCMPDMTTLAGHLYIGCDRRLVPLYERSFPGAIVGGYRDMSHNAQRYRDLPFLRKLDKQPDRYIEAGSLFRLVRRKIEDFPVRTDGYLTPDPERVAFWKTQLDALGPGPKVGIGWESMNRNSDRNKHYVSLDQWKDIFGVKGVTFVNLQHGDCEAQLKDVEGTCNVNIFRPPGINLKDDLDDLAALIKALDVVLCPAIAITTMSLAMGTEMWLLARKAPWWQLGKNGPEDTSPIGPTRLFVHDDQGGWETPLLAASKALKERV